MQPSLLAGVANVPMLEPVAYVWPEVGVIALTRFPKSLDPHATEDDSTLRTLPAHRQAEHYAGRRALTVAAGCVLSLHPSKVQVSRSASGAPQTSPVTYCSITHEGGIAAALASKAGPCGIDLVQRRSRTAANVSRLSSGSSVGAWDPQAAAALFLALKEATFKAIGHMSDGGLGIADVMVELPAVTPQGGAKLTVPRVCLAESLSLRGHFLISAEYALASVVATLSEEARDEG